MQSRLAKSLRIAQTYLSIDGLIDSAGSKQMLNGGFCVAIDGDYPISLYDYEEEYRIWGCTEAK